MGELGLAPKAAGADACAGRKIREFARIARDKAIAGVFAFRDGGKRKAHGSFRRNVLHAVNGEVGSSGKQRFLEFLDENAFCSDLLRDIGHGGGLKTVARSADANELGLPAVHWRGAFATVIRLPQSQRAAARGDAQRLHSLSSSRPKRWRR